MNNFTFPVGFSFLVEILGSPDASGSSTQYGFREVSGISASTEVENYFEGGEKRLAHKLPGRVLYQDNLELKQGLILADSAFGSWCTSHFSKGLNQVKSGQPIQTKDIILHLIDPESRNPLISWAFARAYPVKMEVSGFNAQKSELIIVNLSLAYAYFVVLNN
jgi:phage tail-like protein